MKTNKINKSKIDAIRVEVIISTCVHCKENFTSEVVFAIGYPYHCLLHKQCLPFYDFTNIFPHPKPKFCYEPKYSKDIGKATYN